MQPIQNDVNLLDLIRVGGLFTAFVVIVATWVVVRVVTVTATRLGERFAHRRLQLHQAATFIRFTLWIAGLVVAVVLSFSLSREALLAIGGTAAVTIGFALKDLAASILAGLIIILDRPFQVGDRVNFAGTYGEIEAIGLRSVRLVTLDNQTVTIPNNKFLTDAVASANWGALDMMVQLDFHVTADEDFTEAKRVVEESLTTSPYVFLGKPWIVQVTPTAIAEAPAIRIRAQAYVLDVQYEKQFSTDVCERVLEGFLAKGIRAPTQFEVAVHNRAPRPERSSTRRRSSRIRSKTA
jgi:small-conductance mechanosensitive channel